MGDRTKIEWTDATWNPVVGCTKVSPGCDHCYAERVTERFNGPGSFATVTLKPDRLDQPLRWRRPRRVFVNSMSDLFHDDVPDYYIGAVFGIMAAAPQHTFQVLTKRHGRMRSLLSSSTFTATMVDQMIGYPEGGDAFHEQRFGLPLPNVWLGVSVETQQWADIRIPSLLETPAAVRFLSCEPLLGPIDLGSPKAPAFLTDGIDWVIAGGESGHGHRPPHLDWIRSLRDQCRHADVPFLFKQWGGNTPKTGGRELDGRTWDQYPAVS